MAHSLLIMNNTSGFVLDAAMDDGYGLRMSGHFYVPDEQLFYLEPVIASGNRHYRIVQKSRGTFVHGRDDGTGDVLMHPSENNRCQIFEPLDVDGSGKFRFQNVYSQFYLHANNDGTSDLQMQREKNDVCQLFLTWTQTKAPWD
jgi:hypothetical protein